MFHIDAAKQESYDKEGIRYREQLMGKAVYDFSDESISPSPNADMSITISGTTLGISKWDSNRQKNQKAP